MVHSVIAISLVRDEEMSCRNCNLIHSKTPCKADTRNLAALSQVRQAAAVEWPSVGGMRMEPSNVSSLFRSLAAFGEGAVWVAAAGRVVMLTSMVMGHNATNVASFFRSLAALGKGSIRVAAVRRYVEVMVLVGLGNDAALVARFLGCFAALGEGAVGIAAFGWRIGLFFVRDYMRLCGRHDLRFDRLRHGSPCHPWQQSS